MKVVSVTEQCAVLLCAFWCTNVCAVNENQPALASSKYGIKGEPAKIDTAFGNTGEVGPRYEVPKRNETAVETSPVTSSTPSGSSEEKYNQNKTVSEVTIESSSVEPPTQLFNTSTASAFDLSTTTQKSVVPTKTTNESAPAAGDSGTTTAIEMSTTETPSTTEASTKTTSIPGGQSVSPSQIFETSKPTRKPTAVENSTKPGQQNGTSTDKPNSSFLLRPLPIVYCLSSIVVLITTRPQS